MCKVPEKPHLATAVRAAALDGKAGLLPREHATLQLAGVVESVPPQEAHRGNAAMRRTTDRNDRSRRIQFQSGDARVRS